MHSMTHPQAMWPGPLWPVLLSLSLFPASLGTVRRRTEGPRGGRHHLLALPQCRGGGGAVWPLFHPTLSDSLPSAVPRVQRGSPLFLASLPSPTFQSLCSLSVSSIVCVCHLPFSAAPSACLGSSGCCLLDGESTVFCPQGSLGAVPDPRAGLHWHLATHTPSPGLSLAAISSAVPWLWEE